MEKDILEQIRTNLLGEKSRIEAELEKIGATSDSDVKFRDIGSKSEDNAQEVTDYENRLSLVQTLKKELEDLDKTLLTLDKGDYGTCKYCKKQINPLRLIARPTSGSCVECKSTLQSRPKIAM